MLIAGLQVHSLFFAPAPVKVKADEAWGPMRETQTGASRVSQAKVMFALKVRERFGCDFLRR